MVNESRRMKNYLKKIGCMLKSNFLLEEHRINEKTS